MSGEGRRYQANGFIPINEPPARRSCIAATVTIVKGDVLHDNGSGLLTNATTALDSATLMGIAAEDCDNSGGSATLECAYYPIDSKTLYIAPVAANAEIAQTAIGSKIDLENNDDLDISDTVTTGSAFFVTAIDICALAIAANTYGYAIGHFGLVVTES